MKKLLLFLGLKLAEVLGVVFIPLILGHIIPYAKWFKVGYWLNGLLAVAMPIAGLLAVTVIFYVCILQPILYWLSFNWNIVYKDKDNPFADLIRKLY